MPLSNSRMAYEEEYKAMDRALEARDGVRIPCEDKSEAYFFRMRMNKARSLDREFSGERYPAGHPMRHQSHYDALILRIRQDSDGCWLYVRKRPAIGAVEEIKRKPKEPVRETVTLR